MNDIFWLDEGAGRAVVLLHGGFLDHHMWDDQVPALAADHRVIAPDARGHGRSANAAAPFRPADDVAALLRHLDAGPAVLVGVSMGAGVAVDTALEHPGMVRGLVVTGAGTSEPYFTDPWTVETLAAWTAAMAAGDLDASVERFVRLGTGPYRAPGDVDAGVMARQRGMARATMAKHAAGEPDPITPVTGTWERAAGITVPVLAVHGALDSPDHIGMAERLAGSVPDGRTVTIDGTAHYPNMERPGAYNAVVRDFLGTL